MLLIIEDEHKKHLQFLTDLDSNVLAEFCRISTEFIIKGSNIKIYQSAAQKLGVEAETVRHGVEGLMFLLTESAKLMLSDVDFLDSILTIGFPEPLRQELLRNYKENVKQIREVLAHIDSDYPHYHSLEWRCDVQLATRSLHHQVTPLTMLKLITESKGEKKVTCLQTDIPNLAHLTEVLDQALHEAKSQHCQRLQRHIK